MMVVGVDGGTFNFIKPLIEEGRLPNFEKIMKEGVYGKLKSTVPPSTVPAWYSYLTGKDPGKLGFYAWSQYNRKNKKVERFRLENIKEVCFWDYFDKEKSGIVNIPSLYPPEDFNGWFVAGFGVPGFSKRYTSPIDFKKEIEERIGDYRLYTIRFDKKNEEEYIENLYEVMKQRFEVSKYLWEEKEVDFLNVVFRATDQICHYCAHNKKLIFDVYEKMDEFLSWFLETGENIIIISDHGFSKEKKLLQINSLLEKIGYLKKKRTKKSLRFRAISKISGFFRNFVRRFELREIIDKYKSLRDLIPEGKRMGLKNAILMDIIDWDKTKAFGDFQAKTGFVYINREVVNDVEKEKKKIISRLKKEIKKLGLDIEIRDSKNVWTDVKENFPDIVLLSKNENLGIRSNFDEVDLVTSVEKNLYDHDFDGIFMAYGPDLREGFELNGAKIIDVAPTVLHSLGKKIPKNMDGKVLKKIFREASNQRRRKVEFGEPLKKVEKRKVKIEEKDEEKIKQRLKDLGYMD